MSKVNSLLNLAKDGYFTKNGETTKLPISIDEIKEKTLDVYEIPLKYLYFNQYNGRISSIINNDHKTNSGNYNNDIANLIKNNNKEQFKTTTESIKKRGQQIFGYVLNDGCVIDGNRRFAALRNINKETGKSQYFKAVILPLNGNQKNEQRKIKELELNLQWGVESKQKYDDVDEAVDAYKTIEVDKLMTIADYANDANKKQKTIKQLIETTKMIHRFLDFIHTSPNNYSIIKDTKTYTLFSEATRKFMSEFPEDSPEKDESIDSFFAFILLQIKDGESTLAYKVRDYFKNIVKSPKNDSFNEDAEDTIDSLDEKLSKTNTDTASGLNKALHDSNDELNNVKNNVNNYKSQGKSNNEITDLIEKLNSSEFLLAKMDENGGLLSASKFDDLTDEESNKIKQTLTNINSYSNELKERFEND